MMAENKSGLTPAAVGGGAAAGIAYGLHRRSKRNKALAAAAQEAAEKAKAEKAVRKVRLGRGGKALAGLALLGAGAAAARKAGKSPRVRKAVASRRIASAIERGAELGTIEKRPPVPRVSKAPSRKPKARKWAPVRESATLRRPQATPSERRSRGAYAANMASNRMRKVGNADMGAFSDELQDILEKDAGIRRVVGGVLKARSTATNPMAGSKGLDPITRLGDKYTAYVNKKAIRKAKKAKVRKDRVAPLLSAIDQAFPG